MESQHSDNEQTDITKVKRPAVLKVIYDLLRNTTMDKIRYLYNDDGGWEGWFQSELGYHIRKGYDAQTLKLGNLRTSSREYRLWEGSSDRVDILYTYSRNQENCKNAVELKCTTFSGDNRPTQFARNFSKDIAKLIRGRDKMKTLAMADAKWVYYVAVGISLTKPVYNATMKKLGSHPLREWIWVKTIEGGISVWSLWGISSNFYLDRIPKSVAELDVVVEDMDKGDEGEFEEATVTEDDDDGEDDE